MEVLGVGSTSNVHRCLNNKDDNYYACKIIDKYQMEDRFAGMMAQFQTEIEALKQLQHPSIIQLYDVYLTDTKIYIIMELMEGGELFDYVVQKGTLNEEEASKIVRRVTSALVYMHEKVREEDAPPPKLPAVYLLILFSLVVPFTSLSTLSTTVIFRTLSIET
jgi:serine/threonine protein kinase